MSIKLHTSAKCLLTAIALSSLTIACTHASHIVTPQPPTVTSPPTRLARVTATFNVVCPLNSPTDPPWICRKLSPSATSSPTLFPLDAFPEGSLARALAGSPECQLPCWLGLTPNQFREGDLHHWLVAVGLGDNAQRTDYETGSTVLARSVNPAHVFSANVRLVSIQIFTGNVSSIAIVDIPVTRPVIDELSDLALLLGVPDYITLDWTPGDSAVSYALRFVYLSRELQVSYFGIAEDITFNGHLTTAVCLGKATNHHFMIDINPALRDIEYNDFHNLATSQGLTEDALLALLLDPESCIPF